jgi:hypothetical protein
MSQSDRLRQQILASVAAQPSRTRPQGRRRAVIAYAVAVVAMLAIFEASGGFAHANARPQDLTTWLLVGAVGIAALGAWTALGRGGAMTGRASSLLAGMTVAVPIASFVWLVSWHGSYADPEPRFGWRCLALTLAMGGALLAAITFVRRGTTPVLPALHGAAAGAAAGACAGVLVDAWCPLSDASHVLVGHVGPMIALSLVGALAGKAIFDLRPSANAKPR